MSSSIIVCIAAFIVSSVFGSYLPHGGPGAFGGPAPFGGPGPVGGPFPGAGPAGKCNCTTWTLLSYCIYCLLAPLHAPCATSAQCVGVAVCVQQVCECPAPLYRAVGGACQFVTYNTFHTVPAVRTSVVYAYPGNPCGPSLACTGGSTCLSVKP